MKSMVIRFRREEGQIIWGLSLTGKNLEEVESFTSLEVDKAAIKSVGVEESHRVGEMGAMRNVWKKRSLSLKAMMGLFDDIVIPLMLYE